MSYINFKHQVSIDTTTMIIHNFMCKKVIEESDFEIYNVNHDDIVFVKQKVTSVYDVPLLSKRL